MMTSGSAGTSPAGPAEDGEDPRAFLDRNPGAVCSLDLEGRFTAVTPAAAEMTGYPADWFPGRSWEPLVAPEQHDAVRERIRAAAGGAAGHLGVTLLRRDGRRVRADATMLPILVGRAVVGVFGIARDAAEGTEERRDRAEEAARAGKLAHDLNNLLAAIRGNADLALMDLPAGSVVREDVEEIRRAADRAAGLTRQLMALSRRQEAAGEDGGALARGTETVLLAEDEDAVRQLVRRVLERGGYTVLEAVNGEQALVVAAAHDGPVHLLLTDLHMPRMGGEDLARRLGESRPGMRVLFLSGYPVGAVPLEPSLPAGAELVAKPFTAETLAARVRALLDRPREA